MPLYSAGVTLSSWPSVLPALQQQWQAPFSPIPSKTSGLPLITALGFAVKLFMLLKWKHVSLCVFGALHTLERSRILPFYVYMMDFVFIDPKSLHEMWRLEETLRVYPVYPSAKGRCSAEPKLYLIDPCPTYFCNIAATYHQTITALLWLRFILFLFHFFWILVEIFIIRIVFLFLPVLVWKMNLQIRRELHSQIYSYK